MLFGTAMDEDVQAIKNALYSISQTTKALGHDEDRLLSVVNQTRRFVSENRWDIKKIKDEMGHMINTLGQIL